LRFARLSAARSEVELVCFLLFALGFLEPELEPLRIILVTRGANGEKQNQLSPLDPPEAFILPTSLRVRKNRF
jgi:hypothetical protein